MYKFPILLCRESVSLGLTCNIMKKRFACYNPYFFIVVIIFLTSCIHEEKDKLFTKLSPSESGVVFSNDIHDSDSSHSFINEFGYMGGGVGIGDFNDDGLKDIFF